MLSHVSRVSVAHLQSVRVRCGIPLDIAGATLMGAGSSITELFTSMTDAFDTRNSIGTQFLPTDTVPPRSNTIDTYNTKSVPIEMRAQ